MNRFDFNGRQGFTQWPFVLGPEIKDDQMWTAMIETNDRGGIPMAFIVRGKMLDGSWSVHTANDGRDILMREIDIRRFYRLEHE